MLEQILLGEKYCNSAQFVLQFLVSFLQIHAMLFWHIPSEYGMCTWPRAHGAHGLIIYSIASLQYSIATL